MAKNKNQIEEEIKSEVEPVDDLKEVEEKAEEIKGEFEKVKKEKKRAREKEEKQEDEAAKEKAAGEEYPEIELGFDLFKAQS